MVGGAYGGFGSFLDFCCCLMRLVNYAGLRGVSKRFCLFFSVLFCKFWVLCCFSKLWGYVMDKVMGILAHYGLVVGS